MTKLSVFDPYSVDDHLFMLANHLPIGKVWQAGFKTSSNLGKYLRGLCLEFYRFSVLTSDVVKEFNVFETNQLLVDWEKSVGIPDSCFSAEGFKTITERRQQVEAKLAKFGGVQTKEDFEYVASIFGISVQVFYGAAGGGIGFPITFPTVFISYADYKEESHTIIVVITGTYVTSDTFALPFPIPFSSGPVSFLQCIFRKLAPANVEVIVLYSGVL